MRHWIELSITFAAGVAFLPAGFCAIVAAKCAWKATATIARLRPRHFLPGSNPVSVAVAVARIWWDVFYNGAEFTFGERP